MGDFGLDVVTINVGGKVFQTRRSTLEKLTGSRLSNQSLLAKDAVTTANTYFVDRDPLVFQYILNFHRTGELHLPPGGCRSALKKELEFWMVPEDQVSECCWKTLYGTGRDAEALRELKDLFYYDNLDYMQTFKEWKSKWSKRTHRIWMFLEYPKSSLAAKIWGMILYSCILISAFVILLDTMDRFRQPDKGLHRRCNFTRNVTVASQKLALSRLETQYLMTEQLDSLRFLDIGLSGVFSFEFIARFIVCPRKYHFIVSFLNACDLLYISTQWSSYALKRLSCMQEQNMMLLFLWLKVFGFVRLLRLFRIGRSFQGFKVLLLAMKYSKKELFLLVCTFIIITMSFAVIVFLAEMHQGTFADCFVAWWWSVVTMTTVGYGDVYPVSATGRVIGSVCAVVGLVMLTLPIAVIGTNFSEFYNVNKDRELYIAERKHKCKFGDPKKCLKTLARDKNIISAKSEKF